MRLDVRGTAGEQQSVQALQQLIEPSSSASDGISSGAAPAASSTARAYFSPTM